MPVAVVGYRPDDCAKTEVVRTKAKGIMGKYRACRVMGLTCWWIELSRAQTANHHRTCGCEALGERTKRPNNDRPCQKLPEWLQRALLPQQHRWLDGIVFRWVPLTESAGTLIDNGSSGQDEAQNAPDGPRAAS
jgi:hypothetical protein